MSREPRKNALQFAFSRRMTTCTADRLTARVTALESGWIGCNSIFLVGIDLSSNPLGGAFHDAYYVALLGLFWFLLFSLLVTSGCSDLVTAPFTARAK